MKIKDFRVTICDMLNTAKAILSSSGELIPTAFIYSKSGIDIIGLMYEDNEERHGHFSLMRKLIEEKEADSAFIISESWLVESNITNIDVCPSEHPMRKECIFAYGECEEGYVTIVQIFEREGDKIIFKEKVDTDNYKSDKFVSKNFQFGIYKKEEQDINLSHLN